MRVRRVRCRPTYGECEITTVLTSVVTAGSQQTMSVHGIACRHGAGGSGTAAYNFHVGLAGGRQHLVSACGVHRALLSCGAAAGAGDRGIKVLQFTSKLF